MKAIKFITAASIAAALGAVFATGVGQAKANTLYDNGQINGGLDGFNFNGFQVSDSFTLSSPSTLTSVQIGVWDFPNNSVPSFVTSVDWSIGSAPYGTDVAPQTASATNDTALFVNTFSYFIYEDTFPISATLPAGTYWLTLQNAVATNSGTPLWDENNGPSSAFDNGIGSLANFSHPGTTGSESFQIYGSVSAVPEPASLSVLGLGVVGLLARRRRRA